jgi:hypothetical protein
MRLLASISLACVLLSACSAEQTSTPEIQKGNQLSTADTVSGNQNTSNLPVDSSTIQSRPDVDELLESFTYCRDNSENSLTCKYFIAKAICQFYGIEDFKGSDGEYIDFEEILPEVKASNLWERAGDANDQLALDKAQKAANNGKAALAISEGDKYGHVVMILPGTQEKAPSWGNLNCPKVASFFMVPDLEPFVERSLAFAWSTPVGIGIYIRK